MPILILDDDVSKVEVIDEATAPAAQLLC